MLLFGLEVVWSGTENLAERLCCPGSRPNAEAYLCSTPPLLLIVHGILQDNYYPYITTGRVPSYDPNIGGRHSFYIPGVVPSFTSTLFPVLPWSSPLRSGFKHSFADAFRTFNEIRNKSVKIRDG